jgi:hypothetical protein
MERAKMQHAAAEIAAQQNREQMNAKGTVALKASDADLARDGIVIEPVGGASKSNGY